MKINRQCVLFLILFLSVSSSSAKWTAQWQGDFFIDGRKNSEQFFNPNNQVIKNPNLSGLLGFKPDFTYATKRRKIILRPRLLLSSQQIQFDQNTEREIKTEIKSEGKLQLQQAYYEYRLTKRHKVIAGLQVYQWGPAELMNPSNPFFHLNTQSRSAFFEEKGLVALRTQHDLSDQTSLMFMIIPLSNNEASWRTEQKFKESGLGLFEYRAESGLSYVGMTAGVDHDQLPFIGEYFVVGWDSGWSIYADMIHFKGNRAFYPEVNASGFMEMVQSSQSELAYTRAVAGVRWEGRVDLRAEVFFNGVGYDKDLFEDAQLAIQPTNPFFQKNLPRFLKSGIDLVGQKYSYLSLRVPDLGRKKDISFYLRNFNSLQDSSGVGQIAADKPFGDHLIGLIEASTSYGGKNREMTLGDSATFLLGLKWVL